MKLICFLFSIVLVYYTITICLICLTNSSIFHTKQSNKFNKQSNKQTNKNKAKKITNKNAKKNTYTNTNTNAINSPIITTPPKTTNKSTTISTTIFTTKPLINSTSPNTTPLNRGNTKPISIILDLENNIKFLNDTLSSSGNNTCRTFRCSKEPLPLDICGIRNTTHPDIIELEKCITNYECPYEEIFTDKSNRELFKCKKIPNHFYSTLPGDKCHRHSDCVNDICEWSYCKGKSVNSHCLKHEECDIGLYCDFALNNTCLYQKANKQNCTDDFECVNTDGCYNNKCTEYLSLLENTTVSSNNELLCTSNYLINNQCRQTILNSSPDQTNFNDKNYICDTTKNRCEYSVSDGSTMNLPCRCSLSSGTKACPLGTMTVPWQGLIQFINNYLRQSYLHTTRRFNFKREVLYREIMNYHRLYDSKPCEKELITVINHSDKASNNGGSYLGVKGLRDIRCLVVILIDVIGVAIIVGIM